VRQVRSELTQKAEHAAVEVFATNLKRLLLSPPVRGKTVLGIDPGSFFHHCMLLTHECIVYGKLNAQKHFLFSFEIYNSPFYTSCIFLTLSMINLIWHILFCSVQEVSLFIEFDSFNFLHFA
jgi:hypothetical protein